MNIPLVSVYLFSVCVEAVVLGVVLACVAGLLRIRVLCFSRLAKTGAHLKGIHEGREVSDASLLSLTPHLQPQATGKGC